MEGIARSERGCIVGIRHAFFPRELIQATLQQRESFAKPICWKRSGRQHSTGMKIDASYVGVAVLSGALKENAVTPD
jgi:hypothetical protein